MFKHIGKALLRNLSVKPCSTLSALAGLAAGSLTKIINRLMPPLQMTVCTTATTTKFFCPRKGT